MLPNGGSSHTARCDHLGDAEWAIIALLLPNKPRGVPLVEDQRVLNGIFWTLRTGSPWRDLPNRYGPYTTVYNQWAKAGVAARLRAPGRAIARFAASHRFLNHPRPSRTVDPELYRQRNLIERFFNKHKHLRRIATRYDKLARNFLAAIALASIRLRVRHNESTT